MRRINLYRRPAATAIAAKGREKKRREKNNKTKLPLATAAIPGHQPTTTTTIYVVCRFGLPVAPRGMNLLLPAFGVSDLHETEMRYSESWGRDVHTLEISVFNKAMKGKPT